jgi:hypothetical protein
LRYYLDGNNKETFLKAGASGLKAGYTQKTAWEIPTGIEQGKYAVICRGLDDYRVKLRAAASQVSPNEVLNILKECCNVAANPALVELWPKDYRYYYGTVMKGVELAGKYLKLFVDVQERNVNISISQSDQTRQMMDTLRLLDVRCPVCNEPVEIEINNQAKALSTTTLEGQG